MGHVNHLLPAIAYRGDAICFRTAAKFVMENRGVMFTGGAHL